MTKAACPKCGSDNLAINTRYIGKELRKVDIEVDGEGVTYWRHDDAREDEVVDVVSEHFFCWDCDTDLPTAQTQDWEEGR